MNKLIILIAIFGVLGCANKKEAEQDKNPLKNLGVNKKEISQSVDSSKKIILKQSQNNTSWLGKWIRVSRNNDSYLEIKEVRNNGFKFEFLAFSGSHNGEWTGNATIAGNKATSYTIDGIDTCLITFELNKNNKIVINQTGLCGCGADVYYTGEYRRINAKVKDEELSTDFIKLGILKNKKEDNAFKKLVGKDYETFISTTQLISEDEDLDNLDARVYSSFIRGLPSMGNIIMVDANLNIWAAVIDDKKIYYFTNHASYKTKIPKTIENWMEGFKDYKIIYK